MTDSALLIGLPSKGRIHELVVSFLEQASFKLKRSGAARGYSAMLESLAGAEVQLLSASEVARALAAGDIHVGITGLDLIEETPVGRPDDLEIIRKLGFSKAKVVVAVPKCWLDVDVVDDLVEIGDIFLQQNDRLLTVATKFDNITRAFFAKHGLIDYRIIPSPGATEGAPAAGTADIIVDITETGSTLVANQLKILNDGVILKSEAVVAASIAADWSDARVAVLREFMNMIEARAVAERDREIRVPGTAALSAGVRADLLELGCSISAQDEAGFTLTCASRDVRRALSALSAAGFGDMSVHKTELVMSSKANVLKAFETRLKTAVQKNA